MMRSQEQIDWLRLNQITCGIEESGRCCYLGPRGSAYARDWAHKVWDVYQAGRRVAEQVSERDALLAIRGPR